MSHFLRGSEHLRQRTLDAPRAGVTVKVERSGKEVRLVIQSTGIAVLKRGAQLTPLPEDVFVVTPGLKKVKPSAGQQFYVTLESLDPMHLVVEL